MRVSVLSAVFWYGSMEMGEEGAEVGVLGLDIGRVWVGWEDDENDDICRRGAHIRLQV